MLKLLRNLQALFRTNPTYISTYNESVKSIHTTFFMAKESGTSLFRYKKWPKANHGISHESKPKVYGTRKVQHTNVTHTKSHECEMCNLSYGGRCFKKDNL